ncbi:hypothetical protein [Coleofasciculus sp.]|uniref:hypothetical protein n=1 Tax=Coleofasciculus sp. TaxID=3100458 RepID=UPI0039F9E00E
MSYSQFTLDDIEPNFNVTITEKVGIFNDIPQKEHSQFLQKLLSYNIPLALDIATEKARSEMIITPILIELKKQFNSQISLFSGKEFNVDLEKGLTGYCDYLISYSPSQLLIKSPVITLVEAKNDNIQSGLAQCMAEMIAAQLFNQNHSNSIPTIYGGVTTGTNWKFMRLTEKIIEVDSQEYFLNPISKIIGILSHFIRTGADSIGLHP